MNTTLRTNLSITFLSIFILLLGLELYARWVLDAEPVTERMRLSPTLGWEWTPGYDAIEALASYQFRMQISTQGLRNEEVITPKPEQVFRILSLGDSVTSGIGVDIQDTFSKQLERKLKEKLFPQTFEVINAGTDDYGLRQELIWLETRGLGYQPDLILLNVYLNDAREFSPPPSVIAALDNFLTPRSASYAYYRNWTRNLLGERASKEPGFRFRYKDVLDSRVWVSDQETLTKVIEEANQDWGMAWNAEHLEEMGTVLAEFIEVSRSLNIPLIVTLFPSSVQVYADVETSLGLTTPQGWFSNFAAQYDLLFIDPLPALQNHPSEDLYIDQAHLTVKGHTIIADLILQTLQQRVFSG